MPTLVEIVPYDPNWPRDFSSADTVLRKILGTSVVAVDHVGSTAIPRMSAKPIIDIDITLSSLAAVPSASRKLIDAGYEPRGNRYDDVWAFILKSSAPKLRVYLCPPQNRTHERRVMFRDYLRHHDEAAEAYSTLKKQLAEQFPYDGDRYTAEKSMFVQEILVRAQSERSWPH
ncbi:GrpB family protein [Rhizobium rhizogenes]|uniref:GrpB family protein n=1 Tax=Rhizobium rhizogenes TaxID=359 RepID=UPI001572CF39|nr:GrpB family protein [Rhizobium rhizogenes]MDJ1632199.1 GrpB family protein [Rhizobium rhizogenes]NTG73544.1 GrpB family protein [Rhizobium rhizogenes]